jgi:hypothetical protein
MLLTYTLLILVTISEVVCGYDVDTDLARGLVCNDLAIVEIKSIDNIHLSDYPVDCAAVYLNAKKLNQNVFNGIYEIWPREGNFVFHLLFESCSTSFV